MSHFLARLVDRTRGTASRVEPIIASRFASAPFPELRESIDQRQQHSAQQGPLVAHPHPPKPSSTPRSEEDTSVGNDFRCAADSEVVERSVDPRRPEEANKPLIQNHRIHKAVTPGSSHPRDGSGIEDPLEPRANLVSNRRRANRPAAESSLSPRSHQQTDASRRSDDTERTAPVVRVTIGRIEVRAGPGPVSPTRDVSRRPKPTLPLDAYLKERKEGAR
jgi:hypothetical protein